MWIIGHVLTDEKMYGIFSMLFGAGVLLMTSRVEQRGHKSAGLHYRRMAWLMLFGLLHGFLLWPGDILWTYGVAGLDQNIARSARTYAIADTRMLPLDVLMHTQSQYWCRKC